VRHEVAACGRRIAGRGLREGLFRPVVCHKNKNRIF
jgi:hypothetical protein